MALRNVNGKYITRNLYLAAYLETLGYYVEVKREESHFIQDKVRYAFYVPIDDRLEYINEEFYANRAKVEPIAFGVAIKNIKSQLHA